MSPRARNGANSRRELDVSETRECEAVRAVVDEERTRFEAGKVASSSSVWTAIAVIVAHTDFPSSSLHNTSTFRRTTWIRDSWWSPCLLLSLLWVRITLETPAGILSHDYSRSLPLPSEIAVPCKQHRIRRCIRRGKNCYSVNGTRSILFF